jgi:hypothetical protein
MGIPKSGYQFSEKIMLHARAGGERFANESVASDWAASVDAPIGMAFVKVASSATAYASG